ncbi:hypothetical protein Ancab_020916 [Ancistrocladus abbreviatus]
MTELRTQLSYKIKLYFLILMLQTQIMRFIYCIMYTSIIRTQFKPSTRHIIKSYNNQRPTHPTNRDRKSNIHEGLLENFFNWSPSMEVLEIQLRTSGKNISWNDNTPSSRSSHHPHRSPPTTTATLLAAAKAEE